jgi:uncharacterized protein YcbK (DUF882 family)
MSFTIKHKDKVIFTESEFFVSSKFPDMARESHEKATKQTKACLYLLATLIMAPMRIAFGVPITITSGFRSIPMNNALRRGGYGTAQQSLHSLGIACDFTTKDVNTLRYIFNYIRDNLPYGELIIYMKNGKPNRIHVSLPNGRKFAKVKED